MNAPPGYDTDTSGEDVSDGEAPPPAPSKPAQFSWSKMLVHEPRALKGKDAAKDDQPSFKKRILRKGLKKGMGKGKAKAKERLHIDSREASGASEASGGEEQETPRRTAEKIKKRVRIVAHDESMPEAESEPKISPSASPAPATDGNVTPSTPERSPQATQMLVLLRRLVAQNMTDDDERDQRIETSVQSPTLTNPHSPVYSSKTLPPGGLHFDAPVSPPIRSEPASRPAQSRGALPPPMYPHPASLQPWHPSQAANAQRAEPAQTSSASLTDENHWTVALTSVASCLSLGYSLYLAYKAQHGDKTHSQLGKALAKELAAQRSVSHAVENVFGDAAAGKEFSTSLKQAVGCLVKNGLLSDSDRLQGLIVHLLPKSDSQLGSWLNPKLAQVLLITAQKWVDKQLDVGSALQATSQVKESQGSEVRSGFLDHFHASLLQQVRDKRQTLPAAPRSVISQEGSPRPQPHARPRPIEIGSPTASLSESAQPRAEPSTSTYTSSPSQYSHTSASAASSPSVPSPPPSPSPSPSPAPPDSPGTLESDDEASRRLSMADSGPSRGGGSLGRYAAQVEEGERKKRPSRYQVKAAREVLYPSKSS